LDNECFAKPVRADVMIDGRKIAGAAQRRTRRGLLQQGSIQGISMNIDLAWKFAQALSANCSEFEINEEVLQRAREIAHQKYGTESWLRMR
jgi:lipoate-protein ligase A